MEDSDFLIFISHRQKDQALANALSQELQKWGILEANIFNSSRAETAGTVGSGIQDEVLRAVKCTDLFLLIYSQPNEDWWWCSYELGAANSKESKQTSTVVFHCGQRLERGAAGGALQIDINSREEIYKFALDFHRRPEFVIPDSGVRESYKFKLDELEETADAIIEQRTEDLFTELKDHIPEAHEREIHRWDYILLSLNPVEVSSIELGEGRESQNYEDHFKAIKENLEIRSGTQNSALRKFGYQDFEEGLKLKDVIKNYANGYKEIHEEYPNLDEWVEDLCSDVVRAIRNNPPKRTYNSFVSIGHDAGQFRPAVIRVRRLVDRGMEFDCYLYRVTEEQSA